METKTINGRSYDVYTNADWERDKTLKVQVGQVIEPDVFWQLCNALPPHRWCMGVFQPGEAYSHDWDKGCALYQTFEDMGGDYYKYVGLKS
jgi:hypothetical protein